jgi:membrane-associated phospholipid phosphatase
MKLGMRPGGCNERADKREVTRLLFWMFAASVAVFTAVAVDVTHGGPLARADQHVAHWSFRHVPNWLHVLCRWATHLGDASLLAVFVVFASAWLLTKQRRVDAVLLASAAGTTALVTMGLKQAFRRSRPVFVDPDHGPRSFSFPSGHSSGAFAVYLLLALLLAAGLSGRIRARLIGGALALATLVAATRVLLPVHYLTDVIAGTCIGLAAVAAAMLARAVLAGGR